MPKRRFEKKDLLAMVYDCSDSLQEVERMLVGTSRWSLRYEVIFKAKDDGKHYQSHFSCGATENQVEEPYDDCDDSDLVCSEVEQREVTVDRWVAVDG